MFNTENYKFWFITGSQFLYGPEVLDKVEADAKDIVDKLNESGNLPYPVEFKLVATTSENIAGVMKEASTLR